MKVAVLFSGGKDSTYAIHLAKKQGWNVTNLITLQSERKDSWMFHTINIHLTSLLAEAFEIPIIIKKTEGEKEKELEDLQNALKNLNLDGVVSGAIASEYQKNRIEKICKNLDIKSLTPLWHKNQEQLLYEMIEDGFEIIIVGVYAMGFDENWLGRTINKKTIQDLISIEKKYAIQTAGEGGEFETLVIDGPIFKKRLVIDKTVKNWKRDNGFLEIKKAHLEEKIL